jgi:hypothetical protein
MLAAAYIDPSGIRMNDRALQSTFGWADSLRLPAGLLLFMRTPDLIDWEFGPVPMRKEKLSDWVRSAADYRTRTAKPMPQIG